MNPLRPAAIPGGPLDCVIMGLDNFPLRRLIGSKCALLAPETMMASEIAVRPVGYITSKQRAETVMEINDGSNGLHPQTLKYINDFRSMESFGTFLNTSTMEQIPNAPLDDLKAKLDLRQNRYYPILKSNKLFDNFFTNTMNVSSIFDDQCSPKYYYDLVNHIINLNPGNIVECGSYDGGMTVFLAQVAKYLNITLDTIDINNISLNTTYNYIMQACPDCLDSVRFFHGNLASYISGNHCRRDVQSFFQIDAGHDFIAVVEDLVSIWFVRNSTQAIALQDIHLRSDNLYNTHFIESAICAVFGKDFKGHYFGEQVGDSDVIWAGDYELYFQANALEGVLLLMSENKFCYPRQGHVPVLHRARPLYPQK